MAQLMCKAVLYEPLQVCSLTTPTCFALCRLLGRTGLSVSGLPSAWRSSCAKLCSTSPSRCVLTGNTHLTFIQHRYRPFCSIRRQLFRLQQLAEAIDPWRTTS